MINPKTGITGEIEYFSSFAESRMVWKSSNKLSKDDRHSVYYTSPILLEVGAILTGGIVALFLLCLWSAPLIGPMLTSVHDAIGAWLFVREV